MDWIGRSSSALICAVAVSMAATAGGQEQPPGENSESVRESVMLRYPEIIRAQQAVMSLLSRALSTDPGLDELRVEFEQAQAEAMVALDPLTTQRVERMAELQALYDQVVATEKTPDISTLLEEGRQLRKALQETAVQARRKPEVAKKADAFASALELRFQQIDPEAFALLAPYDGWVEAVWAALLVSP